MLGGGNTGGGIQNDTTQHNNIEDSSQVQMIWMTKFHFSIYAKNRSS